MRANDRETVGYLGAGDECWCPMCWRTLAAAGERPASLLTTGTGATRDPLRILDACAGCGAPLDYDGLVPLV